MPGFYESSSLAYERGDQRLQPCSPPHSRLHVSSELFILTRRRIDRGEPDFLRSGYTARVAA